MAKSTRTADIEQYLKDNHYKQTMQELADAVGKSRRTVSSWLKELELTAKAVDRGADQRHKFTEAEIVFLRDNWFEPVPWLSEKLSVSEITIKKHLRSMGLERPQGKIENMRLRAQIYRERCGDKAEQEWHRLPSTRFDAKREGVAQFWNGQACETAGHISPRKTSSGGCWECERLAAREKYKNDPIERARQKSYNQSYYRINEERVRQARKEWYESGGREVIGRWRKNELESNPSFKVAKNLRDRLSKAVKDQKARKNGSMIKILGCEIEDLIAHLEAQFTNEMNWENYGNDTWHIDHIRPCASFDLADKEQQYVCFNWRNLQPLSRFDNISKLHSYAPSDEEQWVKKMRDLGFEGELFLLFKTNVL